VIGKRRIRPVLNENPKYVGGHPAPPKPWSAKAAFNPNRPLPLPPHLWPEDDDTYLTEEV
jgi:hypothetical protein